MNMIKKILTYLILFFLIPIHSYALDLSKKYIFCHSLDFPERSFGIFLKKNQNAKIYRIDDKTKKLIIFDAKLNYENTSLFQISTNRVNSTIAVIDKNINFYDTSIGTFLGGCVIMKNISMMKCKLEQTEQVRSSEVPMVCN